MMKLIISLLALLPMVFCYDKVRLADVSVITLKHGAMTSGRRNSPVPQLKCVGGSASGRFEPATVQCVNKGFDGRDFQWECKADMDDRYRFGEIAVTCEGFDYPDDPYILHGSCGLEYNLEFTEKGRQQQQGSSSYGWQSNVEKRSESHSTIGSLAFLLFVGVVIYIIYNTCIQSNSDSRPPRTRGSGGFGGGFDHGPSPPPPGFHAPPPYSEKDTYANASAPPHQSTAGSGPGGAGFWTGLGAGGLLGYLMGGNQGGAYQRRPWFGGGGQTYYNDNYNQGYGSSSRGYGSGSSGPSTSSSTHTSSGFGGTRRR